MILCVHRCYFAIIVHANCDTYHLSRPATAPCISNKCGRSSVGKKMVDEALSSNPAFDIYFGIDGWMLSTITAGMNPVTTPKDAIYQVALMGLLRFVSLFYLLDFGRITQQCHDARKKPDAVKSD